jgi:hypothetical protein
MDIGQIEIGFEVHSTLDKTGNWKLIDFAEHVFQLELKIICLACF